MGLEEDEVLPDCYLHRSGHGGGCGSKDRTRANSVTVVDEAEKAAYPREFPQDES